MPCTIWTPRAVSNGQTRSGKAATARRRSDVDFARVVEFMQTVQYTAAQRQQVW